MLDEDHDHPAGSPAGPEGPATAADHAGPRPTRLPVPPDPLLNAAIHALQGAVGGEEHEERIFRCLFPQLLILFANCRCRPEEAKDLTQDVLLSVFENIEDYRFEGAFWAWVKRIAVNRLSNHLRDREALKRRTDLEVPLEDAALEVERRTRKSKRRGPPNAPTVLDDLMAADQSLQLRNALPHLPEKMREVMVLRLGGLAYEEIADTLGVSLNTVRSQLNAAKKRLRRILAPSFPELGGGEER